MVCLPDLFLSECPEEAYDPRSLYERLQEQREKKQQEFEEQFKFSKHQQQTACVVCTTSDQRTNVCVLSPSMRGKQRLQESIIEILDF